MNVIFKFTYGSPITGGDILSGSSLDPFLDGDEVVEGKRGCPLSL